MSPQQMRDRIDTLEEEIRQYKQALAPGKDIAIESYTALQTRILRALAAGKGKPVSRTRLIVAVYGLDPEEREDLEGLMRVHINALRRPHKHVTGPRYRIETCLPAGSGYRMPMDDCHAVLSAVAAI